MADNTPVLVDSNVLLDVATEDPSWYDWSSSVLTAMARTTTLCINPLIYAEVSVGYSRIEDLEDSIPASAFYRAALPYTAGFLASKAFLAYRRGGGTRVTPLPDFYIGAHAAVENLRLLTRDCRRYRSYFPTVELICPDDQRG